MRTLPLFLLAATPALACGSGNGSTGGLLDGLVLVVLFFVVLNPKAWLLLFVLFIMAVALLSQPRRSPLPRAKERS